MTSPQRPTYRSHLVPRTTAGRIAVATFLVLFALTQPPVVFFVNRVKSTVLGWPAFFGYLLVLYALLIGVLIWAKRRDI